MESLLSIGSIPRYLALAMIAIPRFGMIASTEGGGQTVMTTVQKFQEASTGQHPIFNEAENIFVMVGLTSCSRLATPR